MEGSLGFLHRSTPCSLKGIFYIVARLVASENVESIHGVPVIRVYASEGHVTTGVQNKLKIPPPEEKKKEKKNK
jgi:hypothetical protein